MPVKKMEKNAGGVRQTRRVAFLDSRLTDPLDLIKSDLPRVGQFQPIPQDDERHIAQAGKEDDTDEAHLPGRQIYSDFCQYAVARAQRRLTV